MPGELSLAHQGVLFLDELTEFKRTTLELLRQPLEEHKIRLVRQSGTYCYPSDVMLVAAMNPCACGYYPDRNRCRCTDSMIEHHIGKVSKPFWDRMDLCIGVPKIHVKDLTEEKKEESSEQIRMRVEKAHEIQKKRFWGTKIDCNSRIPSAAVKDYSSMGKAAKRRMEEAFEQFDLSARGYYKILRVARTIADLEGSCDVLEHHIAESLLYRSLDGKVWGRG